MGAPQQPHSQLLLSLLQCLVFLFSASVSIAPLDLVSLLVLSFSLACGFCVFSRPIKWLHAAQVGGGPRSQPTRALTAELSSEASSTLLELVNLP